MRRPLWSAQRAANSQTWLALSFTFQIQPRLARVVVGGVNYLIREVVNYNLPLYGYLDWAASTISSADAGYADAHHDQQLKLPSRRALCVYAAPDDWRLGWLVG